MESYCRWHICPAWNRHPYVIIGRKRYYRVCQDSWDRLRLLLMEHTSLFQATTLHPTTCLLCPNNYIRWISSRDHLWSFVLLWNNIWTIAIPIMQRTMAFSIEETVYMYYSSDNMHSIINAHVFVKFCLVVVISFFFLRIRVFHLHVFAVLQHLHRYNHLLIWSSQCQWSCSGGYGENGWYQIATKYGKL